VCEHKGGKPNCICAKGNQDMMVTRHVWQEGVLLRGGSRTADRSGFLIEGLE